MQLDFYLTLGNTSSQIPLKLNGQSFSLKLGVLENRLEKNDLMSNTYGNKRLKRVHYQQ
jgi:hypothetical protein